MAPTPEVSRRIDLDLSALTAEADFLPELTAGWAAEPEANQAVWYLEWRDLLARLQHLERDYQSGGMTESQRRRYRALLGKLRQALPHFERLGLLPLPVSLDA